jgi:hypothetical protein
MTKFIKDTFGTKAERFEVGPYSVEITRLAELPCPVFKCWIYAGSVGGLHNSLNEAREYIRQYIMADSAHRRAEAAEVINVHLELEKKLGDDFFNLGQFKVPLNDK